MSNELSRLEEVELREVWSDEAQDFTPWLAEEENLSLLGETLGLELYLEAEEVRVGAFQADILCKDEDGSWILIENQLNETDHDHLGKILTYSAGLNADTIIWIARKFREEHRAALDRQNEITDSQFSCFGIEIRLWKIGESNPAPKFEVVCKPNDWSPNISRSRLDGWKSKFWNKLNIHFQSNSFKFNIRRPGEKNTVHFGIGNPDEFSLQAVISQQKARVGVRLSLKGDYATAYFHILTEHKEEIENDFGKGLEWEELPNQKSCAIAFYMIDTNVESESGWNSIHNWLSSHLTKFDKVFRQRLQEINPTTWDIDINDVNVINE